jgi:hypothetical protein
VKNLRAAIKDYNGGKGKISIYIVKENFLKIVAFKGLIRQFLNMVAAHIEVLMHPPHMLT